MRYNPNDLPYLREAAMHQISEDAQPLLELTSHSLQMPIRDHMRISLATPHSKNCQVFLVSVKQYFAPERERLNSPFVQPTSYLKLA